MSKNNQKQLSNNTGKPKQGMTPIIQPQDKENNNQTQVKDPAQDMDLNKAQKMECSGRLPSARFGHTLTMVSSSKIVMFGGAVGDTKNFVFSNETYSLNLLTKVWNKLESKFEFKCFFDFIVFFMLFVCFSGFVVVFVCF